MSRLATPLLLVIMMMASLLAPAFSPGADSDGSTPSPSAWLGESEPVPGSEMTPAQETALEALRMENRVSGRAHASISGPLGWEWVRGAGGSLGDIGMSITLDPNGNLIIYGVFQDTASFGTYSISSVGQTDLFVAKMNSSGEWQWVVKAGSSSPDTSYRIDSDSNGDAYVVGYYSGTISFGGSISLNNAGGSDGFVAKIDSSGTWVWADSVSGTGNDACLSVSVAPSGNVVVGGSYSNSVTLGTTTLTTQGDGGAFIAQRGSSAGATWQWATSANGTANSDASVQSLIHDNSGNIYLTGSLVGTVDFGADTWTSSGDYDVFVAKLDSSGQWVWSLRGGGADREIGYSISLDSSGNAYVYGHFEGGSSEFGSTILNSSGDIDMFVVKVNPTGAWVWATSAGGTGFEQVSRSVVDSNGDSYFTGSFHSTAINFGTLQLTNSAGGDQDIFVAKLDNQGSWQWALSSGGTGRETAMDLTLGNNGELYLVGIFDSNPNFGSLNISSDGDWDILVAKLSLDHDEDGTADATDEDDDDDGVLDSVDDCPKGELNWLSTINTDYNGDGCQDSGEDLDDDNDGVPDGDDDCQYGDLGWTSDSSTDYDSDGCQDSGEDDDDDNDGVLDDDDACKKGDLGWTSNWGQGEYTDADGDGCQDSGEDLDDDNDTVLDGDDDCQYAYSNWISNSVTDHDSDGCRDDWGDNDDDNDGTEDDRDDCARGDIGWSDNFPHEPSHDLDYDEDGCRDAGEDDDDDGDYHLDSSDACPRNGAKWWNSSDTALDHDSDGCRDSDEDDDDDNDGVPDVVDDCPTGDLGWTSDSTTDHDGDGCQDSGEDTDDDADGFADDAEDCPLSPLTGSDLDGDGCLDDEDDDDDGDGVADSADSFPLDASEDTDTDHDGIGNNADADDDGDGVDDAQDAFPLDESETNDTDGDMVGDNSDLDDDGDGVDDDVDAFPLDSGESSDFDGDGIGDNADDDDDGDGVLDADDACPTTTEGTKVDSTGCLKVAAQAPESGGFLSGTNLLLLGALVLMTLAFVGSVVLRRRGEEESQEEGVVENVPVKGQLDLVNQATEAVHFCTLCQGRMKPTAPGATCGGCGKPYHASCAERTDTCVKCGTAL
jgi:hypothetical protein